MYCMKLATSIPPPPPLRVLEVTAIMLCQACRYQVSSIMYNSYELMVLLFVTLHLFVLHVKPGGRKVLKPTMRSGWPLNSVDTRLITPGVYICYITPVCTLGKDLKL